MQASKLARNVLLWLLPAAVLWIGMTDFYNRFLTISAQNLLHLAESPNVTELHKYAKDDNYVTIHRRDFPAAKSQVYSVRVTDLHYHLVLLFALFLSPPGVPWRQRLANLGWALLVAVFFHLVLFFFWVKFAYATQLGAWSVESYGAFARNFFGLGKHLLDLPFKLALPFALFIAFYLPQLRPSAADR